MIRYYYTSGFRREIAGHVLPPEDWLDQDKRWPDKSPVTGSIRRRRKMMHCLRSHRNWCHWLHFMIRCHYSSTVWWCSKEIRPGSRDISGKNDDAHWCCLSVMPVDHLSKPQIFPRLLSSSSGSGTPTFSNQSGDRRFHHNRWSLKNTIWKGRRKLRMDHWFHKIIQNLMETPVPRHLLTKMLSLVSLLWESVNRLQNNNKPSNVLLLFVTKAILACQMISKRAEKQSRSGEDPVWALEGVSVIRFALKPAVIPISFL